MAQQRTASDLTWQAGATPARAGVQPSADPTEAALAASAEFRELARQRRFVRGGEQVEGPASVFGPKPEDVARLVSDTPEGRAIATTLMESTERLALAHQQIARATARAEHAERELAAANDRLMAANVLVQDAQRATHQTAERCAWLEGRNEALQEALEVAVHASLMTRWRWRRQLAKSKKSSSED